MTGAVAGPYPERAIQLVVPFPPGGPADIVARPLAEKLSAALGQPIVVVNKPGASGTVGAAFVVESRARRLHAADRHQQRIDDEPGLYAQAALRSVEDFAPITTVILFPNVLVVNKDLPVKTAQDLVALTLLEAGQDQLRHQRHRQHQPPHYRALPRLDQGSSSITSPTGRRAGHDRSDRAVRSRRCSRPCRHPPV